MCFTGKCSYESYLGECTLTEAEKLSAKEKFQLVSLCMVPEDPEHQAYIEESFDKLQQAAMLIFEGRLASHRRR